MIASGDMAHNPEVMAAKAALDAPSWISIAP